MGFKEVTDLSAEVTISLGGYNKKAKKENPTTVEGYYLGTKTVPDKKKQSGESNIYFFQTKKGNIGVWGKTDLDRKMTSVTPGTMTRASYSHMQETQNGPMYKYKVEVDANNTIEVSTTSSVESYDEDAELSTTNVEDYDEESDNFEVEERTQNNALSAAERKAKVESFLKTSKSK